MSRSELATSDIDLDIDLIIIANISPIFIHDIGFISVLVDLQAEILKRILME